MVRLFNVYYPKRTLALVAVEAVLVLLALLVPMAVKYGSDTSVVLGYEAGFLRISVAAAVFMFCVYYVDLYSVNVLANPREARARIFASVGAACIVLAAVYALAPTIRLGEMVILPGILLAAAALFGSRAAFYSLSRSPRLAQRALLLGEGPLMYRLGEEIPKRPELGIRLDGYIGPPPVDRPLPAGVPFLGESRAFAEIIRDRPVDRVIVTMRDRRGSLPVQDLLRLKTEGVLVEDGTSFYETISGRLPLDVLSAGTMLFSDGFHVSSLGLLKKRLCSIVVSFVALVVTSPLMVLIAIAIVIDSRGGALFRQVRVGMGGRTFEIIKFRSMCSGAESESGPVWAQDKDPRVTRVGRVLRKLRLDELPQLVNVLRGDMSIVGPRPERPHFVNMLSEQIPFYGLRHSVPPGITGWAQVCYPYGSTVDESRAKLEYDLFYVKNLSISLDLLILFSTLKIVLLGRGAK
ncbi:MAG TPA: sugar transferase [Terriglobia bacterium]|jgi:sugar transferase (PEP-CTERM system associated)|nr:sugar transferase [Terriglobia bacterium]